MFFLIPISPHVRLFSSIVRLLHNITLVICYQRNVVVIAWVNITFNNGNRIVFSLCHKASNLGKNRVEQTTAITLSSDWLMAHHVSTCVCVSPVWKWCNHWSIIMTIYDNKVPFLSKICVRNGNVDLFQYFPLSHANFMQFMQLHCCKLL